MIRIKDECVKAVGRETWIPSIGYHSGESNAYVSDFWRCEGGAGQFGEQGRGDWRGAAFVGVRILLLKLFSELGSSFLPKNQVV